MKTLLFLACALFGCGANIAPDMQSVETCGIKGLTVEVEAGASAKVSCATHLMILQNYRTAYVERWGAVPTVTVRMRNTGDLRTTGIDESFSIQGHRYDNNVIDLALEGWQSMPHELNHVVHGSGHTGWCSPFEPWQRATLNIDQRPYLCGGAS